MDENKLIDISIIFIILFIIGLKICNVLPISWFWLLSPLWIALGLGTILGIIFAIAYIINIHKYKRR